MLLPHTVTVRPAVVSTDSDGNRVVTASPYGEATAAYVQPRASTADTSEPGPSQRQRVDAVVYLRAGDIATVAAGAVIIWGEQPLRAVSDAVELSGSGGAAGLRYQRVEAQRHHLGGPGCV